MTSRLDPNPDSTVKTSYLNFTPCAIGLFYSRETGEAWPAPCGRWNCVDCGPRKARRFQKRIAPPRWNYMITLTLEGDGTATPDNIKRLNGNWKVFKRWMQRTADLKDFAWVNEQGKKHGRIHKHALVQSSRFSYLAARRAVKRAGFGTVCDFSRVRNQRAVRFYVSKYLTKSLSVVWPRYSRRCQTSLPASPKRDDVAFQPALIQKGYRATWWTEDAAERSAVAAANILEAQYIADSERRFREAQLALIPNTKKCVTEGDAGSLDIGQPLQFPFPNQPRDGP